MKNDTWLRAKSFVGVAILLCIGVIVGVYVPSILQAACERNNEYVNPVVRCGDDPVISKARYDDLRGEIVSFIESERAAGAIEYVSVYFVDLNFGPVWGINQDESFIPASLLKLPLALTLFKNAETNPAVLENKIYFGGAAAAEEELDQAYEPAHEAGLNSTHSVRELVAIMLIDSDNQSYELLVDYLETLRKEETLTNTFLELGLDLPQNFLDASMTTRAYASLYRQLYDASYLSIEASNEILAMLVQSSFDRGIAAGVPREVKVANKFGERFFGEIKQLHDCGIVYYPGNPYLLCVMTQGKEWQELEGFIIEISKRTYEEVDSRRR